MNEHFNIAVVLVLKHNSFDNIQYIENSEFIYCVLFSEKGRSKWWDIAKEGLNPNTPLSRYFVIPMQFLSSIKYIRECIAYL